MRRVVDDLVHWGSGIHSVAHVRIWEPVDAANEPAVVLLGNLVDAQGVSSRIEDVVMGVGDRFLGVRAQQAQFYEYTPPVPGDIGGAFEHVTFAVTQTSGRALRRSRTVGARLEAPSWRKCDRDEIERLVGESIEVYTGGTYTTELVSAVLTSREGPVTALWDPLDATYAATVFRLLHSGTLEETLTEKGREVAVAGLARRVIEGREAAAKDLCWQEPDAVVQLEVPEVDDLETIRRFGLRPPVLEDHRGIWETVAEIRSVLAGASIYDRQVLVPALGDGLARLEWWEVGNDEPEGPSWSSAKTVARLNSGMADNDTADRLNALRFTEDALVDILSEECDAYSAWDLPSYRPAGPLPATSALARRYLASISPCAEPVELYRLDRLTFLLSQKSKNMAAGEHGVDKQGHLVLISKDRRWFCAEWPVGSAGLERDINATVVADNDRDCGAKPVFLEYSDHRLILLPAAPDHKFMWEFTWGYPGSGPANLAAAVAHAVRVAAGESSTADEYILSVARERAATSRTPRWALQSILDEAVSRVR